MTRATDINGKEIFENVVVEIRGAYGKKHNGLWYVESSHDNGHLWLVKLNKDMSKSKSNSSASSTSWPICSYLNDRQKNREINLYNSLNAVIEVLCPYVEPEKKPVSNELKITKKGIRKGEDYCSCYYYLNRDNSVTILARHYNQHIPREVGDVCNESDGMTDYFETDRCVLHPGDRYYDAALRCC